MVGASLYILICSLKNRVRRWLRRVREPRYLTALIVGAAYLFFVVFGSFRRRGTARRPRLGRPGPSLTEFLPALTAAGPSLAAMTVLIVAAGSWLVPPTRTLLECTSAEVQFLFPAPVSRRKLIVHRMMRRQLGLLFGSFVWAVLVPFGSIPRRVRVAVALWMLLFTATTYFSGVALARRRLTSSDRRKRQMARLPLLLLLGGLAVVAVTLARALLGQPIVDVNDGLSRVIAATADGLAYAVLWPFVALVSPAFTANWTEFARALPGAIAVLSAVTAWVLLNDEEFDDLTREVADRQREQHEDRTRRTNIAYHASKAGWALAPTGRAEPAFAWKGAKQTLRVVSGRSLMRFVIVIVMLGVVASLSSRRLAGLLGGMAMLSAVWMTILGPLMLRIDLRQDLQHLEVLKTWPVSAATLIRGEMLWPAALLTASVWAMAILALFFSTAAFPATSFVLRASAAVAVCLVAPALIAAHLTLHNALALLFPAWIGAWQARGVEAMGQRLIVFAGTLLMVTLAAVPGAVAGGLAWLVFDRFIGPIALVPAAAVCAALIGLEVVIATEALGPAYDRLDVTAIEPTE